jgi:hypothetical protein
MATQVSPDTLQQITTEVGRERWMTTIYDNDHTPLDAVIIAIVRATRCDYEEANMETWEAQTYGKAAIHFASEEECTFVAAIMRSIGVEATVDKEWAD